MGVGTTCAATLPARAPPGTQPSLLRCAAWRTAQRKKKANARGRGMRVEEAGMGLQAQAPHAQRSPPWAPTHPLHAM